MFMLEMLKSTVASHRINNKTPSHHQGVECQTEVSKFIRNQSKGEFFK